MLAGLSYMLCVMCVRWGASKNGLVLLWAAESGAIGLRLWGLSGGASLMAYGNRTSLEH